MTRHENLLMRLAITIHKQLRSNHAASTTVELPEATWRQSDILLRRMRRARQLGWHFAAQRVRDDLREWLRRLHGEMITIDRMLEPSRNESLNASIADIYADLIALGEEFDKVSFDRRERTISVTTEPIELDGIYLGPFEIRLDWKDLTDGHLHNYRVIALDANPAAANESTTHPHVQDEAVCEGDGSKPICHALQQGRLLDFFVIVANLLRTYNSGSPYVSLSDWHGVQCADCGTTVSDDERCVCEKCETTLCDQCYFPCPGCDSIFCSECVTRCEGCDENHCDGCMTHCSRCRAESCRGCLDDNERCSDCHDQENQEEPTELVGDGESGGRCAAVAPLQPDRLGEAAVPA